MQEQVGTLDDLRCVLEQGKRGVVFTGAGISTESGIPDFRSPGGVWSKHKPILFQDFIASEEARREAWRRKFDDAYGFDGAEPNRGHRAIARLVRDGKVSVVITQNTDGLHQMSGIPENKVIELHGNSTYAKCLDCDQRCDLREIKEKFLGLGILPLCQDCGGLVKAATISFGQPMPQVPMAKAQEETLVCDFFIAAGSSLQVYPAAGFPEIAKKNGAKLVIINREPTPLDRIANLIIHRELGPALGEVTNVN
ncbi:MAG: Sir2 family NAD-dependent protein deacetylase [Rhodospirillaceae bacterium]